MEKVYIPDFPIDDIIKSKMKINSPKWFDIYFKFLTNEQLILLHQYCLKYQNLNGYFCFLLGLMNEFEVLPHFKFDDAFIYYAKGMKLKDSHSFTRSFVINQLDYEKFKKKESKSEAILNLIMACAYCNELSYREDSLLKYDLNIFQVLKHFLDEDQSNRKTVDQLLETSLIENKSELDYLKNWITIKFGTDGNKIMVAFEAQKKLAQNNDVDAAYNVGIIYYQSLSGIYYIGKNVAEAEKWLLLASNSNRPRNQEALAAVYDYKKNFEFFLYYLQKANKVGSVECFWKLSYFYGSGKEALDNKKLSFSFAKRSFLIFDSLYSTYALSYLLKHILNYLDIEEQRVARKLMFQIATKNYHFIEYGPNNAIQPLAICYEYGLGCPINLYKAIDLHEQHIQKCDEGWKRYSLYRLGVLHEKTEKFEQANKYYEQSLKIYVGEWPSFHYRKGKMNEKGQGLSQPNLKKALEHYKVGMGLNVEFTLQLLFKKKCEISFNKVLYKIKFEKMKED